MVLVKCISDNIFTLTKGWYYLIDLMSLHCDNNNEWDVEVYEYGDDNGYRFIGRIALNNFTLTD